MRIKAKIYILFLLYSVKSFGQINNLIYAFGSDETNKIHLDKFESDNFQNIKIYNFKINKRGKVKKDSLLIKEINYDPHSRILNGLDFSLGIQSHGPHYFTWYKYEIQYDKYGKIIKESSIPYERLKKKRNKQKPFNSSGREEIIYEYKKDGTLFRKTEKSITEDRFKGIDKEFHSKRIKSRIYDYEHTRNGENSFVKRYFTKDSTRNYDNNNPNSVTCNYCRKRYLNSVKEYDEKSNLIVWTTFTKDKKIHTKHIYEYDYKNRILRQIDSTGWYLDKPYLESYSEYIYEDSIKKVIKTYPISWNNPTINTELKIYDKNHKILKECSTLNSQEKCVNYSYLVKDGKIIKSVSKLQNGSVFIREIKYNLRGDISEERSLNNNKLVSLIKYYYK